MSLLMLPLRTLRRVFGFTHIFANLLLQYGIAFFVVYVLFLKDCLELFLWISIKFKNRIVWSLHSLCLSRSSIWAGLLDDVQREISNPTSFKKLDETRQNNRHSTSLNRSKYSSPERSQEESKNVKSEQKNSINCKNCQSLVEAFLLYNISVRNESNSNAAVCKIFMNSVGTQTIPEADIADTVHFYCSSPISSPKAQISEDQSSDDSLKNQFESSNIQRLLAMKYGLSPKCSFNKCNNLSVKSLDEFVEIEKALLKTISNGSSPKVNSTKTFFGTSTHLKVEESTKAQSSEKLSLGDAHEKHFKSSNIDKVFSLECSNSSQYLYNYSSKYSSNQSATNSNHEYCNIETAESVKDYNASSPKIHSTGEFVSTPLKMEESTKASIAAEQSSRDSFNSQFEYSKIERLLAVKYGLFPKGSFTEYKSLSSKSSDNEFSKVEKAICGNNANESPLKVQPNQTFLCTALKEQESPNAPILENFNSEDSFENQFESSNIGKVFALKCSLSPVCLCNDYKNLSATNSDYECYKIGGAIRVDDANKSLPNVHLTGNFVSTLLKQEESPNAHILEKPSIEDSLKNQFESGNIEKLLALKSDLSPKISFNECMNLSTTSLDDESSKIDKVICANNSKESSPKVLSNKTFFSNLLKAQENTIAPSLERLNSRDSIKNQFESSNIEKSFAMKSNSSSAYTSNDCVNRNTTNAAKEFSGIENAMYANKESCSPAKLHLKETLVNTPLKESQDNLSDLLESPFCEINLDTLNNVRLRFSEDICIPQQTNLTPEPQSVFKKGWNKLADMRRANKSKPAMNTGQGGIRLPTITGRRSVEIGCSSESENVRLNNCFGNMFHKLKSKFDPKIKESSVFYKRF